MAAWHWLDARRLSRNDQGEGCSRPAEWKTLQDTTRSLEIHFHCWHSRSCPGKSQFSADQWGKNRPTTELPFRGPLFSDEATPMEQVDCSYSKMVVVGATPGISWLVQWRHTQSRALMNANVLFPNYTHTYLEALRWKMSLHYDSGKQIFKSCKILKPGA